MPDTTVNMKRLWILAGLAFVLFLVIYFPVITELVHDWSTDDNYSHGFLIPLISAFLIWHRRKKLKEMIIPAGDYSGLPLLLLGMILYILATAAAEHFTIGVSLVITLYGMVWMLFGRRLAGALWFELLFLLFMIPLPYVIYNALTFPMQILATKITVKLLNLIGMTAVRQGNIIHLSGYSLEVAEACSGLRSLISLLALGALYARYTQPGIGRQIILFLSTIPIAIAANVFRVFATAVGAYTISRKLAEDFLHEFSGMAVFVAAFIMLFIWGAVLKIGLKKKKISANNKD